MERDVGFANFLVARLAAFAQRAQVASMHLPPTCQRRASRHTRVVYNHHEQDVWQERGAHVNLHKDYERLGAHKLGRWPVSMLIGVIQVM